MMRQYELVERVLAYNPHADEALLNKAYVYAMQKHGMQKRASGDPYFAHPLEVAAILTTLKLDDASIAVGLLHDTIEDTDATRAEIDQLFGKEIGAIVEGLTKIDRLQLVTREEAQAENLRKLLLAISADVRVLLVKLADRLHNMRTLDFMPESKRKRIATETMDIYAPLAGRMGMQDIRQELEDLAFKHLEPEHYKAITDRLAEMKADFAETISTITSELAGKLKSEGIDARVSSRVKSPWSIFSKIERKQIALEQLSDMIGFRLIVPTPADCYRALGVVHTNWKVVPGRFKDYISVPKHNDYRSIHTTIVGVGRQRAELQIRTEHMHRIAELGIAAHALYKEGATDIHKIENESRAFSWLRSTIEHLTTGASTEDFLEYTKLELFQDQVFCFSPRGRLIALPRGATPIDFAYALHTDIGDTCVGAKINGQIVPLVTHLRSGDEVEIIRDQNHLPPPNWETIAATGKARAAIRRAVRLAAQQRAHALGEHMLTLLVEKDVSSPSDSEWKDLGEHFGVQGRRELLIALGEGKVASDDLDTALMELRGIKRRRRKLDLPVPDKAEGWFALKASPDFRFRVPSNPRSGSRAKTALAELSFSTQVTVSAEGVVPGDRMVGIMQPGAGVTIYPIHSDALSALYDSDVAWIDVRWDVEAGSSAESQHPCVISLQSQNRPGGLAQVSTVIAACEANIHNLVMRMDSPDFHKLIFQIEVRDLGQLTDVLNSLKLTAGVTAVRRATVSEADAVAQLEWAAPSRTKDSA
jgi:guanosine-3',5'-bis(diphosphate) 3'-pyrophosphohydrolase